MENSYTTSHRNGRLLGVCASVDNCRLFVGGIPKTKKREEILTEMKKVTDGVMDVIVYPSAADKTKNRGFAFVEYDSHRAAAMARRKLLPGNILSYITLDIIPVVLAKTTHTSVSNVQMFLKAIVSFQSQTRFYWFESKDT